MTASSPPLPYWPPLQTAVMLSRLLLWGVLDPYPVLLRPDFEGIALNQFISTSVTEKISALRTETSFHEHAAGARQDEAPVEGDDE